jgi:hypothetical protein
MRDCEAFWIPIHTMHAFDRFTADKYSELLNENNSMTFWFTRASFVAFWLRLIFVSPDDDTKNVPYITDILYTESKQKLTIELMF